MSRRFWIAIIALAAAVPLGLTVYSQFHARPNVGEVVMLPPQTTEYLIKFGIGDTADTAWDGKISFASGTLLKIEGWRFGGTDGAGLSGWRASTRLSQGISGPGPYYENGVLVTALIGDPSQVVTVSTLQGSFSFLPSGQSYGTVKTFLNGKASVEQVPVATGLTTSSSEQDFPAIAQNGDDVWVSYVEFTHSDRSLESFAALKAAPATFDYLARAAGGDQVFLMHYSKSARVWDPPIAVSDPKQDVVRTAVAVDGGKRVWVFWSANQNGNFDMYARYFESAPAPYYAHRDARRSPSPVIQLSTDPGQDLNPVATTDSTGRVWVAWQGYRHNNLEILARAQDGLGFAPETTISFSPANDWDPAIAAGANGEVAISWDTYDKGDYDVYLRRMRMNSGIQMDAPVPVAASTNFEARSSVVYDPQNRLWIAYEASDTRWGKDFGTYNTTGIALYQGHTIKVKCFQGTAAYATQNDIASVLPAPKAIGKQPDPTLVDKRQPNGNVVAPAGPKNSFPRLAVDSDGKVYLAFRITTGDRNPVGTIWAERMVYFDGATWKGPVTIAQSDALLDNRPALTALGGGDLLMVSAMDHRQSPVIVGTTHDDLANGIEYDLFAAEVPVDRTMHAMNLAALAAETVAKPESDAQSEHDQIAMMRNYRASAAGQNYQVVRGEFHRHTEISFDGGSDGPLEDAFRYLLDTASMDWAMCCDHDNGTGREYNWWIIQKMTDAYSLNGTYTGLFGYERSVNYPEGHRNVLFAQRGVRPLPRLPVTAATSAPVPAPDTQMFYNYLRHFKGITASHTSGTGMGTDWRDNDPALEPVVEVFQGERQSYEMPGAPRTNASTDSIGGWQPLGFISLALAKGYRLGFESSSDHICTHESYANVYTTGLGRQALMDALGKRHIYGSTTNILADVRCGEHLMGEEFTVTGQPVISVHLAGTANFSAVHVIKDGNYVYAKNSNSAAVDFTWQDTDAVPGKTSYYYIRGEQEDGELVWASPMWITMQ